MNNPVGWHPKVMSVPLEAEIKVHAVLTLLTYIPHPLPVLSSLFAVGIKNKIKLLYENKVGRDLQGAPSFDCHVFSLLTKYTWAASVFPDNDRWHIML